MNIAPKVNKKELSRKIKSHLGINGDQDITLTKIENIIDALVESVSEYLKEKRQVFLSGIGTFLVQKRKATRRRNPQNGKEILIPETNVVKFRVFKTFDDKVFSKKK